MTNIKYPESSSQHKSAILIFIKNAIKGTVKTRLASTVGDDEALRIYKELLRHTRELVTALDVDRFVFYNQEVIEDEWSEEVFYKEVQSGKNLGERMNNAFQYLFDKGYDSVMIIGSDCASLSLDILKSGFQKLETSAFVIGPALDGGYYALGMQNYEPAVFDNIEWSTASVFEDTTKIITSLDQTYDLLPALSDIDYEEDWKKYGW